VNSWSRLRSCATTALWAGAATVAMAGAAFAQNVTGPVDGGIDLQPAATEVARDIHNFHTLLVWIIVPITLFVLALLLWVMVRYNRAANPTPKKFTHNLFVEVVWTVVPVIILVVISAFSFPLLFKQERIPEAQLTIKATGNTWNWGYTYADQDVEFISNALAEEDAEAQGRPYRMAVDEPMYVPVGVTVRMLITANDVIHAWSVPSFGVKEDAVPGRVNETWFKVEKPGIYYGFCQELCGLQHSLMPIEVRAVSQEEFDRWIVSKGGQLASAAPAAAPPEVAPVPDAPAAEPVETPAPAPAGQPG
jgi:cytochrome c oxidase subunit II